MTPERYAQFEKVTAPLAERDENGDIVSPFFEDVAWCCTGHDLSFGGGLVIDMDNIEIGDELHEYLSLSIDAMKDNEVKEMAKSLLPSNVFAGSYDLLVHEGTFSRSDGEPLNRNWGAMMVPQRH